jgi:hypothetical protein
MNPSGRARYTAFAGTRRLITADLTEVARAAKDTIESGERAPVLIFDDATSWLVDIDFRGTADDVVARLRSESATSTPTDAQLDQLGDTQVRGRGRPKLGVVAREVTLLPRHWEWLNAQPGGASVALRKLVDDARRAYAGRDRIRQAQEAAYRFMSVMAGNYPGFEEATRALFAGAAGKFEALTEQWPADVRDHARMLAAPAFERAEAGAGAEPATERR